MKKGLILVYDDDEERGVAAHFKERLDSVPTVTKSFEVDVLDTKALIRNLGVLENRRASYRKGSKATSGERCDLDRASILVVDYDLFGIVSDAWNKRELTGEEVSYLARCFSDCGLIVGLNQFGDNPFDLTLKGNLDSFADLNIGGKQLDNPGLWSGDFPAFRPWHWPDIPQACDALEARAKQVAPILRHPILKSLGLRAVERNLPRSTLEFLGDGAQEVSFLEFVQSSGNALRDKDGFVPPPQAGRIAAARIFKWLERRILSGQDILVDAPHLVSRYPSLLKGNHKRVATWNSVARLAPQKDIPIRWKVIEGCRFGNNYWISRPAWFWGRVTACQDIPEAREPWSREATLFEFCEDTSRFHRRSECREFVAELDSPYVQRFIRGVPGVDYRPRLRMSIAK